MRRIALCTALVALCPLRLLALNTPTPSWTPVVQAGTPTPTVGPSSCLQIPSSDYSAFVLANEVHPQTVAQWESLRAAVLTEIWKGYPLPSLDPVPGSPYRYTMTISHNITPIGQYFCNQITGYSHIDSYDIGINPFFSHKIYHVFSSMVNPLHNGKLVIVHGGHSDNSCDHIPLWPNNIGSTGYLQSQLLNAGYDLLIVWMPLFGPNDPGIFEHGQHGYFANLETSTYNPLDAFLADQIIALNYVIPQFSYNDVYMVGLSGGGWTTTLEMLIDRRITKGYAVAGSHPKYLRFDTCSMDTPSGDLGDWEQARTLEGSFSATRLEQYVLDSIPEPRRMRNIINAQDTCCFGGVSYKTYDLQVQVQASLIGGDFRTWLDTSTIGTTQCNTDVPGCHQVSVPATDYIMKDMDGIQYLDDSWYGYWQSGQWKSNATGAIGYMTSDTIIPAGTGTRSSSWHFGAPDYMALTPGLYRVSVSYPAASSNASFVIFSVLDGSTQVAQGTVNQQLPPGDILNDANANWVDVGTNIRIQSGSATVVLSDAAGGNVSVVGDAVRLELLTVSVPTPTSTSTPTRTPTGTVTRTFTKTPTVTQTPTGTIIVPTVTPVGIDASGMRGGGLVGGGVNGPLTPSPVSYSGWIGSGSFGGGYNASYIPLPTPFSTRTPGGPTPVSRAVGRNVIF